MRKMKLVLLTLAITTSASLSAFAAHKEGWVQEKEGWYYYDKSGEVVEDTWKTDSSKNFFYLGEDGKMVTSSLVESGDSIYFVDEHGVQVKNQWRLVDVENDDHEKEPRWFYFGSNGKAYEDGWKTINGKKYSFDDDCYMNYGWLDAEGNMVDSDGEFDENAWKEATYYCGNNTTGWRVQDQWISVTDFDDSDEYENKEILWVYFDQNGKKVTEKSKTINGKKYMFDENGAMVSEWYGSATASDAQYKFYDEESGSLAKDKWFQAVPSIEQDEEDYNNDTLRWFYASRSGETYKDTIKKINGKYYIFDEYGIMRTGFILVDENKKIVEVLGDAEEDEMPSAEDIKGLELSEGDLMYFDATGARRDGKITVNLDDDKHTMKFTKGGVAIHGASDNYLYDHGILIKAEDYKYEIVTVDDKDYLVNKSGKIQKAKDTPYKDSSEDIQYIVEGNISEGFVITIEDIN